MAGLICGQGSALREYSLKRFTNKYGLDLSSLGVRICYDECPDTPAVIIKRQEISDKVEGAIHRGDYTYPLFEKASETTGSEVLAIFSDGLGKYPVISFDGDRVYVGFDILNETGQLLCGFLERYWPVSTAEARYLSMLPLVDIYDRLLLDCLQFVAKDKITTKSFWPKGSPFALVLSHDVDLYRKTGQYFSHSWKMMKELNVAEALGQLGKTFTAVQNPYWNVNHLVELEEDLGVKSTFYFLDQRHAEGASLGQRLLNIGACRTDIPEVAQAMRTLSKGGWDVEVHQSLEAYRDGSVLKKEKERLEDITRKESIGVRQHYLRMDMPGFWRVQRDAGFSYDSTVGFTQSIGFRSGTAFPYPAFDAEEERVLDILEIPLMLMERNAIEGSNEPWDACRRVIDVTAQMGGMCNILFHQRFFNEEEFPGYSELYKRIIEYCRGKNAWIASVNEVYRWWSGR